MAQLPPSAAPTFASKERSLLKKQACDFDALASQGDASPGGEAGHRRPVALPEGQEGTRGPEGPATW